MPAHNAAATCSAFAGPARRAAATLLLTCLMVTLGCETSTTQNTAGNSMLDHYNAGRYQQAYDEASRAASTGTYASRENARYVAGVSAYQIGRNREAIRYLEPLTDHHDRALAGRANATLGLVHVNRGDYERAISYFERAVRRLEDEDLAHAYYHLARAQQRLGRWTQARTSLSNAMNNSRDEAFRDEVREHISTTGWTLQFGAFSTRSSAERAAREIRSAAARAGLGSPRISPSTAADGSTLYRVQSGSFATYNSALEARRRLGRSDTYITGMNE